MDSQGGGLATRGLSLELGNPLSAFVFSLEIDVFSRQLLRNKDVGSSHGFSFWKGNGGIPLALSDNQMIGICQQGHRSSY